MDTPPAAETDAAAPGEDECCWVCAPEDEYADLGALWSLMKTHARTHNFSLLNPKREKTVGSGLWRGTFKCAGCNTKQAHVSKSKNMFSACFPCFPPVFRLFSACLPPVFRLFSACFCLFLAVCDCF
jgi:hypothetical protein